MMKKIICLLFVVTLVTGCAGMNDTQRTQSEGAGIGAASGAAAGALIGQLLGGDTGSTLFGAAVGGILGAAAGGIYGDHVAQKKEAYANMEDYYNACIVSARKVRIDAQQYNASLENDIRSLDQKIDQLVISYQHRKVSRKTLAREQKKVRAKLDEANENLQIVKNEIAIQKQVLEQEKGANSSKIAELDREIDKLEQTARELGGQTMALASLDERVQL